jgi:hypothetical protein
MSAINNKEDRSKNEAKINYIRVSFKVDFKSKTKHKNEYNIIDFVVRVYVI